MNTYSFTQYARATINNKAAAVKAHFERNSEDYKSSAIIAASVVLGAGLFDVLSDGQMFDVESSIAEKLFNK